VKIALVAPLERPVPPTKYGSIERIIYFIADLLSQRGHHVDLFASGDSKKDANYKLVPSLQTSILSDASLAGDAHAQRIMEYIGISNTIKYIDDSNYDIINNHSLSFLPFSQLIRDYTRRLVHSHHGILSLNGVKQLCLKYQDLYHVSLSFNQRKGLSALNFLANIYNGVDLTFFPYQEHKADQYSNMIFIGRIDAEKDPIAAIKAAIYTQKRLLIAAKTPENDAYFSQFAHFSHGDYINFLGEIEHESIRDYLSSAKLLLMPVQCEDACPVVPLEAMASGTPVVAFARGALPEQVRDGVTGFLVNQSEEHMQGDWIIKKTGVNGLREAIERMYALSEEKYIAMRRACRSHIQQNFSMEKMIDEYEKLYTDIAQQNILKR
jgi:glycosyltransferase involved in cell wall biosynthesis